jgi:hypothetical protein
LAGESERVFACGVEKFVGRERHGGSVEDAASNSDERDDQDELERIDDVIAQLRGRDVETEDEGKGETEDRSASEDRIDADEKPGSDAPGESFRRCAHAKEREDGRDDAAVGPIVVDGTRSVVGINAIWFVGLH